MTTTTNNYKSIKETIGSLYGIKRSIGPYPDGIKKEEVVLLVDVTMKKNLLTAFLLRTEKVVAIQIFISQWQQYFKLLTV